MAPTSTFKGSTSARFVKSRKNEKYVPAKVVGPMENDAVTKLDIVKQIDAIDSVMGFDRFDNGPSKTGWLINMHATTISANGILSGYSGVDYYFLDEEGGSFKATLQYDPYFLLCCTPGSEPEVEEMLRKRLERSLKKVSRIEKDDLQLPNHLIGLRRTLMKLSFHNISDLLEARRELTPIIQSNAAKKETREIYSAVNNQYFQDEDGNTKNVNPESCIDDIREYDVPYHVRVSIDQNIRVGKWYHVMATHGKVELTENKEKIAFADPVVLAFDIETTKAPLKFPDSQVDQIMMISYMIDGEGFLITNREIISEDIEDFEYTPKPEYPGLFAIFNEADEKALLERFFEHIRDAKPTVIATFNGDFFDWPFVEARASFYDMNMFNEIGFAKDSEGEYKSKFCVHMDCYRWVKRDSYLPQGSQGLKAVTTVKLGYNPTELDPELMTPYAYEKPQLLSEYSVSDAVATYYLYYKYVHPFIFSLCTIIPLNPDEVLRKGTGTLCEMLLMVQAYEHDILLPNKHTDPIERFYDGHLLESETYVGGHVESLEAGVFRSDLKNTFSIDPTAVDEIINDLDNALKFSIEVENNKSLDDICNYDDVYNDIKNKLMELKNKPKREEEPLIYHVDVASMYPNIMTTNRLQPDSMKTEKDCAACDFNRPGKNCDRRLPWSWRGEFYPAEMNEYGMIKRALQNETFPPRKSWEPRKTFDELSYTEQVGHIKKRLSDYSRKVYHRIKQTETVEREAIICQRENPFYVDTVRSFRDRRYEFKTLAKVWKGKASKISKADVHQIDEAKKMIVLYDSLQLAHKVILNSFYGYVMRKGSRWYSMEMAGITCLTGATIIQMARRLVERLGRPLELDTDGIWCILPKSFPEDFSFKMKDGKQLTVSYPCSMLNYLVHDKFTNHQYQELVDPITHRYKTHSDNSIFFEVDGPYKAMILPTSKEEGKGLKKRYAVFNDDGSIAELKGFELKRRGELQLIKNFQSDIFKLFLEGDTLEGCYQAVANVANRWLDVLDSKGAMLEDEDLIELICENKSMSKTLEEYGTQKSTSITTAKRLGDFLGAEMVKDKGLACKYIISSKPVNAPVTERAVPVAIFSSELSVKRMYLRKWLLDSSLEDFDPRTIIDWGYYYERLASVVQKIITIPAALQDIKNPVPRVGHPDWLQKKIAIKEDSKKQSYIGSFFGKTSKTEVLKATVKDIEDFGNEFYSESTKPKIGKVSSRKRKTNSKVEEDDPSILSGTCPSMTEDYAGFLKYQKQKWRVQEKARDRRRKLFGTNSESSSRSTVSSIMRQQAENIAGSTWQVLQYKASPTIAGDIKAYVLIDGKVQTFIFHIPKTVYASFKCDSLPKNRIQGCEMDKSSSILPNGHDGKNLYKLVMPEHTYQEEILNTKSILQDSHLQALYESQISAVERAILELGSTIKYDDSKLGALGKGIKNGFEMRNLMQVEPDQYLKKFSMGTVYLLHIVSNQYEFISVFKSWDTKATWFVLKPSGNAQELPTTIDKIYKELYEMKRDKHRQNYNIIDYSDQMEFDAFYFSDVNKLYKRLNTFVGKIHEERSTKSLFVVQSPYAAKILKIITSISDFPLIQMNVSEVQLPAIGWQSMIVKRIINHYFSLAAWLKHLMELSRYGNIPLCNLQVDNMSYLIDIEYARRLSKANIVLWWSSNALPDHGGFEKDKAVPDFEDLEFPTINNPEIYESAVLEIDIENLTINTILTSALINEAEGTDLADQEVLFDYNNGGSTFAEDSFSGPALNILRNMVRNWWDDAVKDNVNADSMIHSLITWVQRMDSMLYDSSLHYHVHNLTKKILLQLVGEFKRMGSSIIFANRSKLLLQTTKASVDNSYAYGQYIIKAARSKPLFNYLSLNIVKYWDILVWMDQYNYCGRGCTEITTEEEQSLEAYNQWQIKEFLPPLLQTEFEDWVVIFLDSLIKSNSNRVSNPIGTPRATQIQHILNKQKQLNTKEQEDGISNGVCELFRKPLEKRVQQMIRRQTDSILDPDLKVEYTFPTLPGSHLHMRNPTLELVKFLCAIFGLSKKRNIEVRLLRRDLLKLFEVREFSEEATFRNPCTSLKIPHIICEYCNYIKDVDFCRDNKKNIWTCESCDKQFNKVALEERLIAQFNKLVSSYLAQDLRCKKCKSIRSDQLSEYCICSGPWEETITYQSLQEQIQIYENISKHYEMKLLAGLLQEYA